MNQLLFLLLLIKKEICHFIKLVGTFAFWKQCVFDDKSIYIDMYVLSKACIGSLLANNIIVENIQLNQSPRCKQEV